MPDKIIKIEKKHRKKLDAIHFEFDSAMRAMNHFSREANNAVRKNKEYCAKHFPETKGKTYIYNEDAHELTIRNAE